MFDWVYEPTIFDPVTRKWSEKGSLAEMQRPRLYHSTTVLLPTCQVPREGGAELPALPQLAGGARCHNSLCC